MIMVSESKKIGRMKPVACPKCERGRIGNIPEWSNAVLAPRGRPPPSSRGDGVQVKCPVCHTLWTLTIE